MRREKEREGGREEKEKREKLNTSHECNTISLLSPFITSLPSSFSPFSPFSPSSSCQIKISEVSTCDWSPLRMWGSHSFKSHGSGENKITTTRYYSLHLFFHSLVSLFTSFLSLLSFSISSLLFSLLCPLHPRFCSSVLQLWWKWWGLITSTLFLLSPFYLLLFLFYTLSLSPFLSSTLSSSLCSFTASSSPQTWRRQ